MSKPAERRTPLGDGRRTNPFVAERHAPGEIPWLNASGQIDHSMVDAILDAMVDRAANGHRPHAQITGPHGAGKSTLLAHAAARAKERGWSVALSRPPSVVWPKATARIGADAARCPRLACIDSADQMSPVRWAITVARARANGVYLITTTHRDLGCFSAAHLTMRADLARRVLETLVASAALRLPSDAELEAMLGRHNGSLRHVIFELYDCFERGWPW